MISNFILHKYKIRRLVFWWSKEIPYDVAAKQHDRVLHMAYKYKWTIAKEILIFVGGKHAGCSTIWLEKELKT